MKKVLFIISILATLTLLIACSPAENIPKIEPAADEKQIMQPEDSTLEEKVASAEHQIAITADGFSPKTITVKAGDMITFFNEDSNQHWPASAMHPTHTLYPGSDIKKCGSGEQIFDACKGLEQGESFSFTFNEKGSWKYHDHLGISSTGTIVVE
ncbi:MAG: hypothetical protein Q8R47_00265 [Nanoarchaeota archaeon]|nr:hypothetical protein [Nanoarchaeota archaeon]